MKAFLFAFAVLAAAILLAHVQAGEPATRPGIIDYSAGINSVEQKLVPLCDALTRRAIHPPFLSTVEESQEQLDCDGFLYAGKKRWAEFMFADGVLEGVWILTDAEDQERLVRDFTSLYGDPAERRVNGVIFLQANALIRFDFPEVLYYSDRVEDEYLEWFRQDFAH